MGKLTPTQNMIIDASLELFANVGYKETTFKRIAEKSGVKRNSIKSVFASKQEILLSILDKYKHNSTGREILDKKDNDEFLEPIFFLETFAEDLIILWNSRNEKRFIRIVLREQFAADKNCTMEIKDIVNELRSIWWMIFDEMINAGIICNENPLHLAEQFINPLFMIRLEYLTSEDEDNLQISVSKAVKHVKFFCSKLDLNHNDEQ